MLRDVAIAVTLAAGVAALAARAGALARSGAVAATAVGALVFGFAGIPGAALLLLFFVTASLLTAVRGADKPLRDRSGRTWRQVLANGGVAALAALLHARGVPGAWAAFGGALAAATADTWATEVGLLSPERPRLLTTLRPVARGVSGGVTLWGTSAGVAGALAVALAVAALGPWRDAAAVFIGGVVGVLLDSALGATLQRGEAGPSNDLVNLAATAAGAVAAALVRLA